VAVWDEYWVGRGFPWEHDPGPPRNRSWLRLFAETPNYRGLGKAFTGREVFRWHFGPMFYRGRLGDQQVRVLIVGQEGAQDESLAHRSFAGGTGARMQHLLNHLGITRSYLFLNTFVYPIFGQYFDDQRVLAQHADSPIKLHRNRIFDYAASRNHLELAIAVGTAAKESLATWVRSRGGSADPGRLHEADAEAISPRLRLLGVLHPGGATGGASTAIIEDFKRAIRQIERWSSDDPTWLDPDPDGDRQPAAAYLYRSAPIPFRDLPYGTAWRLGRGGTSSNRKNDQTAIQLFSAEGSYDGRGDDILYVGSVAGSIEGYDDEPGDLPYEPPREDYQEFDSGPGVTIGRLLQGGYSAFPWPDFTTFGLRHHPSYGHGPVYRGRLDRPALLLLADQGSHDDLFTGRALTGDDGQHLQAFLRAAGLTRNYGILRTLPVDTIGEDTDRVRRALDDPKVVALYREAIRRIQPRAVVAVGSNAQRHVARLSLGGTHVVEMAAYRRSAWTSSWRDALGELRNLSYAKDVSNPSFSYDGEREQIARSDLPFGTLRWQASSGDRAQRALVDGRASSDYYNLVMPAWTAALLPNALSFNEQRAVERMS
jgi:uracil-DNA glycosylase